MMNDEAQEVKQGFKIFTRCSPGTVLKAVKILGAVNAGDLLKKRSFDTTYKFGTFINLTVEKAGNRGLVKCMYDIAENKQEFILMRPRPGPSLG